ncbi:glycosyltransferase [Vibrio alginolyticus]|uniref:glycosyltransferase family 2 protein n=1 Tax=Vibrio alginolyticus TaxID=663 RepID=UPI00215BE7BC|nr:glycosyltransferase family 2 protein [Vibrio alginolyticus]MCR9489749.1 glycosyltransferase [Vibrio alginolyticus]
MISIITVVYNNKSGMKKTLKSVLSQTYADYELIIVDGCSTDGTVDFCKREMSKFSHIKLLSEKDEGIYDAMNKGIKASSRRWLIFMNSGDEFYDANTLESFSKKECFYDNSVILAYGDKVDIDGCLIPAERNLNVIESGELFACHQSIFFRPDIYYNKSYKIFGDYDLLARIYKNGSHEKIVYLGIPISIFEGGGISSLVSTLKRKEKFISIFNNFGLIGIFKNYIFNVVVWKKIINVVFRSIKGNKT